MIYTSKADGEELFGITVSIQLILDKLSILMVTYVPTILMNAINQAVIYNQNLNRLIVILT